MTRTATPEEVDTAFNVLLRELGVDYADLDAETIANITNAIAGSPKVRNAAINYLYCPSNRAEVMRDRLRAYVLELYESGK